MSTVVCENIQSCFEPRSLSLKLNSSQSQELPQKPSISNSTINGWDCIEALSNTSGLNETASKIEVYVHPLVKRSASSLSAKSLEMCTESLGSETGTDMMEEDILSIMSLSSSSNAEETTERRRKRPLQRMEARKIGYESLPPPLTILRGDNSIRVLPHRENGRLVMTAVSTPPRQSNIHAVRSNGRLTMSLVEDLTEDGDCLDEAVASHNEETSTETECVECDEDREISDEGDEEEEENEEEADLLIGLIMEEDKNGKNLEIGGKCGIKKIERPSRCNESERGNRRLIINMEAYWVA